MSQNWTEDQLAAHQNKRRSAPKPDSAGIVKAKPPLERDIVLVILQYLQARYPKWCFVRVEPSSVTRVAYRKQLGKPPIRYKTDAWGDGVADILGIGVNLMRITHLYSERAVKGIAFEAKRPGEKQRQSQIDFQARWEAAGGLYAVVHDVDEVELRMKAWGI